MQIMGLIVVAPNAKIDYVLIELSSKTWLSMVAHRFRDAGSLA